MSVAKGSDPATLLVGDFNLEPFEETLCTELKTQPSRRVLQQLLEHNGPSTKRYVEKDVFYNPMWNLLGDVGLEGEEHISGSFYYPGYNQQKLKVPGERPWALIDGVLARPAAMNWLDVKSIKFITKVGLHQLLKAEFDEETGGLGKELYSDHLPFVFKVNLPEKNSL